MHGKLREIIESIEFEINEIELEATKKDFAVAFDYTTALLNLVVELRAQLEVLK